MKKGRTGNGEYKDAARKAEVSIAKVSHVINGIRFVSEEATERVRQAIKELNYSPNALANSLKTKKSKTIGLVIPIGHGENFNIFSRKSARILLQRLDNPEIRNRNIGSQPS